MRIQLALFVLPILAIGCDTDAGPDDSEPTAQCGELLCDGGKADGGASSDVEQVVSEEVVWSYRDRIGHGLERADEIAGHVQVYFFGGELPLIGGQSFLQPAFVTMDVPSFENPNAIVERQFYVLLEGINGGQTYGVFPFGHGSIVDVDHPNAVAEFNGSYNFDTRRGANRIVLASDMSVSQMTFDRDDKGELVSTGIQLSRTANINFAKHTFSIFLQD